MLSVTIKSFMLSVVLLNIIMLSVVAPHKGLVNNYQRFSFLRKKMFLILSPLFFPVVLFRQNGPTNKGTCTIKLFTVVTNVRNFK